MLLGGFNKKNADVDYAVKCWDQDANMSNTSRLRWSLSDSYEKCVSSVFKPQTDWRRQEKTQIIKYLLHYCFVFCVFFERERV